MTMDVMYIGLFLFLEHVMMVMSATTMKPTLPNRETPFPMTTLPNKETPLPNIVSVTTTAAAPTYIPPVCPRDFLGHSTSCYHAARIQATWPEAVAYCESFGAELAVIENQQEQDYISQLLTSHPNGDEEFWLGGFDILVENEWQWAITLKRMVYTNWAPGEPSNDQGSEHCLEMSGARQYKWNDNVCEQHKYFICETN